MGIGYGQMIDPNSSPRRPGSRTSWGLGALALGALRGAFDCNTFYHPLGSRALFARIACDRTSSNFHYLALFTLSAAFHRRRALCALLLFSPFLCAVWASSPSPPPPPTLFWA